MDTSLRIIHLEVAQDQTDIVRNALEKAQPDVRIYNARTHDEYRAAITGFSPDLILSAFSLPDISCREAMLILGEFGLYIPFVVVADTVTQAMAEELLQIGIDDYITHADMGRLPFTVRKTQEKYQVKREQKALLRQRSDSEKRFRTLVENSSDAVVLLNMQGQPTYVSLAVKNVLGYTPDEVLAMDIFSKAHPDDVAGLAETMVKVMANPGVPIPGHTGRMLHKDGSWRWIEATVTNLLHEPAVNGIVDNFRDITSQKVSEEKVLQLNRLYAFLSQVNNTLVHAPDLQTVFNEVCRIACETGQFQGAWIGMSAHGTDRIAVVAQCNMADIFLSGLAHATKQYQLLRDVLNTKPYYVANNIQEDFISEQCKILAAQFGYRSCMILSIKKAGNIVGTFNLYASDTNVFTNTEIDLLSEATMEISFSLDVFEKEKQKTVVDQQLQHKERRLRQAQAIAHLGSWETDLATNTSIWSDEACRIYGLHVNDNLQSMESWLSFVHPDDLDHVIQSNQSVLDTLSPADYYHRIIRTDGQIRHVYVQAQIEVNSDGQPVTLSGVLHDVTDKKQADEQIIEVLEERNIILESIGDGFYALDKDWTITYWNKKAALLLNRPKESVLGHKLWDAFPDVVNTSIYDVYYTAVELDVTQHFEYYYERARAWFEITAYPSVNGLSIYFRDVTERKESESELRKLNQNLRNYATELIELNQGLDQFAYIVSHNLRAPVANIIGLGELLSQDAYLPDIKNEFINGIIINVKRIDEVISDLNTVLRIKQEVGENKEIVDLQYLIENIQSNIESVITEWQVDIQTDFSAAPTLLIQRSYLYSIFYHLIINSIKFRRPDRKPVIYIHSSINEGQVMISIKDNGMGIDLTNKGAQIFGLYKRFHQHVEGKGIGLFLVKTQVEKLGGKIQISSNMNEGTEFRIEFCSEMCQNADV